MRDDPATTRHWTEKAAPPLLAVLSLQRGAAEGIKNRASRQASLRRALEYLIAVWNFYVWPFNWGSIPEPAKITDTREQLHRKIRRLGRMIEERTNEYITPIHLGIPFAGWGQPVPECPVTVEAEKQFYEHLKRLVESHSKSRPSRRQAVLRKLAHSTTAFWGTVYGAWPGARNQWTIETLSWEEAADVFDAHCFGNCKNHTPEQARKIVTRLIKEVKRTLPPPNPIISAVLSGTASSEEINAFLTLSQRATQEPPAMREPESEPAVRPTAAPD